MLGFLSELRGRGRTSVIAPAMRHAQIYQATQRSSCFVEDLFSRNRGAKKFLTILAFPCRSRSWPSSHLGRHPNYAEDFGSGAPRLSPPVRCATHILNSVTIAVSVLPRRYP